MNTQLLDKLKKSKTKLFDSTSNTTRNTNNDFIFDFVIIGAGISGLQCGIELGEKFKNNTILILDKSDYIGGRVRTEYTRYKGKKISYECGAGRFNQNHSHLLKLITKYRLKNKISKIPSYWEFRPTIEYSNKLDNIPFENVEDLLSSLVTYYNKPKFKKYLLGVNLYEACRDIYGKQISEYLVNTYSYYSEIKIFNAFDCINSILNDIGEHNQFYILKGGLSQIVYAQANHFLSLNKSCNMCLRTLVGKWNHDSKTNIFDINITDLEYGIKTNIKSKQLIFAVDGKSIRIWKPQFKTIIPIINTIIDSVNTQPLLRTYVIYDSVWFKKYGKVVTDSLVKYIIPIDYKIGLIMISYTDGKYAKKMKEHIDKGTQKVALYKSLKSIFPDDKIEPNPTFIRNEYWDNGASYWTKHVDSKKCSKYMLKPSNKHNLYICGDSFSNNQAWMDGALNTAKQVCDMITY